MAEITQVMDLFYADPLAFGKFFFPHHFRVKSPTFHHELLTSIIDHQYLVVAAPRESSKTTILGFLYPFHQIVFKKRRFIVIITSVYSKSCSCLEAIKKEIRENERLKRYFHISITKDSEGDSVIHHPDGFETKIICKGREQMGTIRGEKFGAYRPDLILLDDVEDDEMVRSPERRQILQDDFDQAVMFAGERGLSKIVFIGTVLHDDGQLAKMLDPDRYTEFKKILYRGRNVDRDGKRFSLWDEKWTVTQLDEMEKRDPVSFAKEIQNDPVSGLIAKFKKEDFRYWKVDSDEYVLFGAEGEIVSRGKMSNCKSAIACDLAWAEKRENDFSVILPAFLTPNSDILVDTYFCKKAMRPDEMEEILFSMESRLRLITGTSVFIGFEKANLEKVMKWLLKEAMRKRNRYLIFKDLMWDADKITRIVTRLQPRYVQHVIYHKQGMGDLEYQLLRIPSGTHDDLPDALQGVVQLLEFPKQGKKVVVEDDAFDWWRKQAIESKHPTRKRYVFGNKNRRLEIPALQAYK